MNIDKIFADSTIVDYKATSSSRKLEWRGYFVSPLRLVKGNSKLHNILIFDMPAVTTCLNASDCKAHCYAMKAQRQYVDTRIFRDTNLNMFRHDTELLKELIIAQLTKAKQTVVRIHSSGDFLSQPYINFWAEIIAQFPNINFYAYTKVDKMLKFDVLTACKNFNLISSVIDNKINFGSLEYCKTLNKDYGTFICPATKPIGGKDIKCGKQCSYCITKDNVCFVQH